MSVDRFNPLSHFGLAVGAADSGDDPPKVNGGGCLPAHHCRSTVKDIVLEYVFIQNPKKHDLSRFYRAMLR